MLGTIAASAAVAGVIAGAALSAAPAAGAATVPAAAQTMALTTSAPQTVPAALAGPQTGLAAPQTALVVAAGTGPSLGPGLSLTQDEAAHHPAPAQPAAAHPATAATAAKPAPAPASHTLAAVKAGTASHAAAPAHPATATHPAAPAPPAQPFEFYDSVTPSAIPAGHEIATYADGPFAVPASQVAGRHVLWIDTNGSDPGANALDVEPGDATPSSAATWVNSKLTADPHATAIVYTMISDWQATKDAVATLPSWMQSHVRWWIADPTGVPHIVPGANATQWYWGTNYDISSANPGF
jgi:hypothetical protein